MTHGSLFSGIGGFDLAAHWMGWQNIFQVEIDPFCQQLLTQNFPNVTRYKDIKTFDASPYRGTIDVLTGGFPCQPFSTAGKRQGTEDDRHLWPEMLRVIREIQPTFVVGENVYGLLNWSKGLVFDEITLALEAEGYQVAPVILPACGVNAPHKRDRIWFVAHSIHNRNRQGSGRIPQKGSGEGMEQSDQVHESGQPGGLWGNAPDADDQECERWSGPSQREWPAQGQEGSGVERTTTRHGQVGSPPNSSSQRLQGLPNTRRRVSDQKNGSIKRRLPPGTPAEGNAPHSNVCRSQGLDQKTQEQFPDNRDSWSVFPTQPPICGRNDGLPHRVERIKALGNAIVPQVALQIFKALSQL